MGTLTCAGVGKVWGVGTDREVVALEDIDLEVRHGEFVVVIGPSGCGKSTLLKLLAGLETPTAGSLLHNGRPITGPDVNRSLIFQQPSLYPWLSARDNVAFGLKLQGMGRGERKRQAEEFLRLVGLRNFAGKHPHELSGGMQQRVAISRALLLEPRLLLMDEPFGALDAMTREEMNLELQRIWNEQPKTVLFITHSIDEAVFLSDRVVVMSPRPGGVRAVLDVELDRPRGLHVREHPRFVEYVGRIRDLIFRKS
jgi:NitT/TauT family transport system ATP-binding protein